MQAGILPQLPHWLVKVLQGGRIEHRALDMAAPIVSAQLVSKSFDGTCAAPHRLQASLQKNSAQAGITDFGPILW